MANVIFSLGKLRFQNFFEKFLKIAEASAKVEGKVLHNTDACMTLPDGTVLTVGDVRAFVASI